jgi:hypothetical protein
MPHGQPVKQERANHDCHNQAKAQIELAADSLVNAHISEPSNGRFANGAARVLFHVALRMLVPRSPPAWQKAHPEHTTPRQGMDE